ncbi:MAG TPA: response regulator [Anaeromyxobacteraceae bacterium]|nr:response regulator [Anaeromyxobacteraceae bacterium]
MSPRLALVVDDSPTMRRQLAAALQRVPGLSPVEASDGADAWRKLSAGTFDILLTDVNMPTLDGLKLISLVRTGGAHQRIPVVVVTTEGADADRRRALELGANAYLVKPVMADQVVGAVTRLLGITA